MNYFSFRARLADLWAQGAWRLQRSSLLLLAGLITLSIVLLAVETVPLAVGLPGLLIIWISAVPALVHLQKLDQSPVPVLAFTGLFYVFFFALPLFTTPLSFHVGDKAVLYNVILLDGVQPIVAILVASGVGAMVAVYYLSKFTIMRSWPAIRIPQTKIDPSTLQTLYWFLIIASLSYRYSSTLQSLPSIGQFLDPVGYLGLGGLFLQWRAGHLPRWQTGLILLIVLPLEARWRIMEPNIFVIIILMVFFVFLLWRGGWFKVIQVLAVVGAIIVAGYSVTTATRYFSGEQTLTRKLAVMGKYIVGLSHLKKRHTVQLHDRDLIVSYDLRISPLVHRFGQILVFQHVYGQSPQTVPYWGGETYLPLLTSFIPRVIYPNKPKEQLGAKFGYVYGLTHSDDGITSFNLPWITELLVNFGPLGVVAGMAVFGLFLAGLDKLFNARNMGEAEFLIGLTLIFRLWYQESNFSVMTGSLLPLFVSLYIYFRFGGNLLNRLIIWAK